MGKTRRHTAEEPLDEGELRDAWSRIDWLRRITAGVFILTMFLTQRLWLTTRSYPLTPVWDWLPQPHYPFDYILFGLMVAALAGVAVLRDPRIPLYAVCLFGVLLALLDQSRWQPYVIHYLVILGTLLLVPWGDRQKNSRALLRGILPAQLLLVFTYFYSGVQKLNYQFADWVFLWLNEPMLGWFGIEEGAIPKTVVVTLALVAAVAEASAGVCLLFRKTRRPAVIFLTAMHLMIMLMIGPLGRNYNLVVLPWNVAMIAALWTLFWWPKERGVGTINLFGRDIWRGGRRYSLTTLAVTVMFGVMPLFSFADLWDSYLSFALYSGNIRDALITVDPADHNNLPPEAQVAVNDRGAIDPFRWSLNELGATVYPEERIAISLGRGLARNLTQRDLLLQVASRPDVLTGERTVRRFRCPAGGGEAVRE